MIFDLILQHYKFQRDAQQSAKEHYDWMQEQAFIKAEQKRRARDIWDKEYGRDAIDVEARVIPETPLLEKP